MRALLFSPHSSLFPFRVLDDIGFHTHLFSTKLVPVLIWERCWCWSGRTSSNCETVENQLPPLESHYSLSLVSVIAISSEICCSHDPGKEVVPLCILRPDTVLCQCKQICSKISTSPEPVLELCLWKTTEKQLNFSQFLPLFFICVTEM